MVPLWRTPTIPDSARTPSRLARLLLPTLFVLASSCGSDPPADFEQAARVAVKRDIDADLAVLLSASRAIQAAAPAPDADGWDGTGDAAALATMRAEWRRARAAYEHIEGAVAVLFPGLDVSTDGRYDTLLAEAPGHRDDNLFDGNGVTGIHAIERILWVDAHPARVVQVERALPGYVAAAYPASEAQARDFRDGLCARLVSDVAQMQREFAPLALDTAAAFHVVFGSIQEQVEVINEAAGGEEESRYAQVTLFDLRNNLEGARRSWVAFRPWVVAQGGTVLAPEIDSSFATIEGRYAMLLGDTIPAVSVGWNADAPSASDLMTPFGQLRTFVLAEGDPANDRGLVHKLENVADMLAIPTEP